MPIAGRCHLITRGQNKETRNNNQQLHKSLGDVATRLRSKEEFTRFMTGVLKASVLKKGLARRRWFEKSALKIMFEDVELGRLLTREADQQRKAPLSSNEPIFIAVRAFYKTAEPTPTAS